MLLRSKSILRRKSAEGTVWVGVPAPIGSAQRCCRGAARRDGVRDWWRWMLRRLGLRGALAL